jgi:hypothetical protein
MKQKTIYKAVVQYQYYGHSYLKGQVVEGTKLSKDQSGNTWLLYTDQSDEPEWVMIEESTLEETEVG